MNTLYYGDNLEILKNSIKDETIDLIYLDPPFQSGKDYNIIFKPEKEGIKGATSQIKTFEDTWNWGTEAENEYLGLLTGTLTREIPSQRLIDLMKAMRGYLAECPMLAYLCMMAPRLLEMRRVLKRSGSIYLHCDPTASHYLKLLMDAVFGTENFRNEIIWKRIDAKGNVQKKYGWIHDVIFFYSKTNDWTWNQQFMEYDESYTDAFYNKVDKDGRRYRISDITAPMSRASKGQIYTWKGYTPPPSRCFVYNEEKMRQLDKEGRIYYSNTGCPNYIRYYDEMEGNKCPDIWTDIKIASKDERMGYPTQKPEALLERIIKANTNEGDVVLDPFCGCGTAIAVSEKTKRQWVGIDITYLSIDVMIKRLEKSHLKQNVDFKVYGVPNDILSATKMAEQFPFQFEVWAVSQLNATPTVKSGDKGVDGIINFVDHTKKEKVGKGIISVKGGHSINPGMVRDLKGTISSQSADFGILILLEKPTKGMIEEAVKEGNFNYSYMEGVTQTIIPKIQIVTVEDLFSDPIKVKLPPNVIEPYKKNEIKKNPIKQGEIEL